MGGPTSGGRHFRALVEAATSGVASEESLRISEELHRRIIETTHQGVCIMDPDYRYLFVNRRLGAMLGYEPGELIGLTVFALVASPGWEAQRHRMDRRRNGEPERGEMALKRKDGSEVWVMFESHPIFEDGRYQGVLSMVMDISERRRTETLLQRSEAQLREAQHVAKLGSWDWDLRTNVLTRSEEYRRMLGLGPDEVEGSPVYDRIHPDDRARIAEEREQSLRARTPWTSEYRLVRDGVVRLVHTHGEIVLDEAGDPVRMVGTVQDVTEKKEAEARIMLADRLVSVGTLALGVAHEINNPLACVTANLDMISEGLRELAASAASTGLLELQDMTLEARDAAERVRRIVRELKIFSRGEEDRPVLLDLQRVLETAINMAFNEIRNRARLVKDYGDTPRVVADEGRLTQVFINLLVNAAQSFAEGQMDRNEIRVVTRAGPEGRASVEIHDNGPGIPADILGRIFDPFFTTKPVGIGAGLGLSVCHGIVTGLGGELSVQSLRGSGSVFRVVLPGAAEAKVSVVPRASVRVTAAHRASVLIVDDDPLVANTLRRVLQEHDVTVTANGREALDVLVTGRDFDVILCDLMMPVMTGMDLYSQLEERLSHLRGEPLPVRGASSRQTPRRKPRCGRSADHYRTNSTHLALDWGRLRRLYVPRPLARSAGGGWRLANARRKAYINRAPHLA